MKNITIRVKDEVARWARVWAARHNTSVSMMLGELLESRMDEEIGYDAAMKRFFGKKPRRLRRRRDAKLPKRDTLYDRGLR